MPAVRVMLEMKLRFLDPKDYGGMSPVEINNLIENEVFASLVNADVEWIEVNHRDVEALYQETLK